MMITNKIIPPSAPGSSSVCGIGAGVTTGGSKFGGSKGGSSGGGENGLGITGSFFGKIKSLKHYKDDVRELISGQEGGVGVDDFNDFKVGDKIDFFN